MEEERLHFENIIETKEIGFQNSRSEMTDENRRLRDEINRYEVELAAAQEEVNAKNAHCSRVEHTLAGDILRMEKKLQQQVNVGSYCSFYVVAMCSDTKSACSLFL